MAAAAMTTANQVGASIDTAVLNTVAATDGPSTRPGGAASLDALVHGYTRATATAAVVLLLATGGVGWLLRIDRRPTSAADDAREP